MSKATLNGRRIILGISGGIAAYKAAMFARLLVGSGAVVDTVVSRGASHFIGGATFAGITGRPAHMEVWEEPAHLDQFSPARPGLRPRDSSNTGGLLPALHIELARAADAIVVAPATAHVLAKAAHGLADDLLTNVLLAATCPILLAPAMHTEMWQHAATQANVAILSERGLHLVGPAEGELAGGDVGEGRMTEPDEILDVLLRVLSSQELSGRYVVVTAGPTREHLDPVRFISNRSSGKMGFALAAEAARRGAEVHLVTGPVELATPAGVERHSVVSAREMHATVLELARDADVVVKAAAVADFRPARPDERKIKKDDGPETIELNRNPDILADLGAARRDGELGSAGRPVLVGFAAETDNPEGYGRRKLETKGADLMAVNDVSTSDAGFETDTNRVIVLGRGGRRVEVPVASKEEVARRVWDEIVTLIH
ncbi:MAG: bifunctional phosphopantothenoylcysteine decarboxylase/phosphopantothenate--cysteine ligase CoaBC [Actinomycetota bacterium]|nr:bifunctional phosphopantothenoylcysteine decarboxylase/phosphopantothenate--cysteine ligase CoaBC [Actinomycetota bacterium]